MPVLAATDDLLEMKIVAEPLFEMSRAPQPTNEIDGLRGAWVCG
jgi:hypothetical protein